VRVAVTGGSGVVGGAVLRHLVDGGHDVAALARSPGAVEKLAGAGAVPVEGDVLDAATLMPLVRGAEVVYHVAGINDMCTRDAALMWRVNVEGTRAVMTACRSEGVRRLVLTSSAVTIGEREGVVADENTVHRGFFLSEYERSKHAAERALLNEADGLDVVSVNPSSVQGPGRATGTGRLFLAAANGRLPLLFDTRISLVDIDDCARGHLLAAERGISGERYLLSGATLSMKEAMRLLSRATGRRLNPWYVTPAAVRAAAATVEWLFQLMGRQAPFCREAARVMLHGHRYVGSRATGELGLVYTPVEDTIRRSLDWFEDQGLLSPGDDRTSQ
jgi:dihydroflavonol-4-reductase